jgi:catechol 2,3-dioxygenase-like lactoylglutathione lyase family enzyme
VSANTYQITPFMHVVDSEEAVRFFVDTLGFTAVVEQPGYAYLEREGAGLRVMGHKDDPDEIGSPHRGYAYYIDVRDVGLVLEQIGDKLALLPQGQVRGPVDQVYGQRELMIRAPDGNLVVFGQAINGQS